MLPATHHTSFKTTSFYMQSFRSDLEMILRRNKIAWNIFACASKELIINSRVCIHTIRSIQNQFIKQTVREEISPLWRENTCTYNTTQPQASLTGCASSASWLLVKLHKHRSLTGCVCVHEVFRLLAQASQVGWVSAYFLLTEIFLLTEVLRLLVKLHSRKCWGHLKIHVTLCNNLISG